MKTKSDIFKLAVVALSLIVVTWAFVPRTGRAHCDTLGGPVVTVAKVALDKGDVKPVLKWVQKKDEDEIRKAFERTIAVRKLNPQAKELADTYFFETLVRIHRAGEGEPYTGLKPADAVEPPIMAADNALETGSADSLVNEITKLVAAGIRDRFNQAVESKKHVDESVEAARQYVKAYVEFIHYVEGLHLAAQESPSHSAGSQSEATQPHEH